MDLLEVLVPLLEEHLVEGDRHGGLGELGELTEDESVLGWRCLAREGLEVRDEVAPAHPGFVARACDVIRVADEARSNRLAEGGVLLTDDVGIDGVL